jgi:hypothetical protein
MTISELIEELTLVREQHGDLEVWLADDRKERPAAPPSHPECIRRASWAWQANGEDLVIPPRLTLVADRRMFL